ncbi:MAG: hypothetical protein SOV27_01535 [Eubacteriales bacterium]|nr:hypothetical protein [Eubacteriales bacterium]
MEEIKNLGEQPENQNKENVQSEIVEEVKEGTTCPCENEGSLGKFKDTTSLLSAYNSLQAEFTKKCQKLSEITKQLNDNQTLNKEESMPVFADANWQENVSNFLSKNTEAQKYSGEIANEILMDKNLQSSPNALELAWARVMQKNYAEPEKLSNDQNFINEKILSRDDVKKQVLEEYFKNLQNVKTPPVITSDGSVASIVEKKPTTMQEAKLAVEKLFNLKG